MFLSFIPTDRDYFLTNRDVFQIELTHLFFNSFQCQWHWKGDCKTMLRLILPCKKNFLNFMILITH